MLVHLLVRLAGAGRIIVSDLHPERLAVGPRLRGRHRRRRRQRGSRRGRARGDGRLGRRRRHRGRRRRRHARARPSTPCATRAPSSGSATASERIEIDMQAVVTRDLTIRGSYGMTGQEFERALALLADGRLPVDDIINRYASLDEGPGCSRSCSRARRRSSASSGRRGRGPGERERSLNDRPPGPAIVHVRLATGSACPSSASRASGRASHVVARTFAPPLGRPASVVEVGGNREAGTRVRGACRGFSASPSCPWSSQRSRPARARKRRPAEGDVDPPRRRRRVRLAVTPCSSSIGGTRQRWRAPPHSSRGRSRGCSARRPSATTASSTRSRSFAAAAARA